MRIVIIGCDQGLGLELAKKCAAEGHAVVAGLRRMPAPDALASLELTGSGSLTPMQMDVTQPEQLAQAADSCRQQLGEIDALVNVAGVLLDSDRNNLLHEIDLDDLRRTFDVNTFGAVAVVKYFYPVMAKDGNAAFVTITSEGCDLNSPGTWIPAYALSKCAATKISGIMNESVPDVKFYAVHPGRMNTEMGRQHAQIEASETADVLCALLASGKIHRRGTWYMDYSGRNMMNTTYGDND